MWYRKAIVKEKHSGVMIGFYLEPEDAKKLVLKDESIGKILSPEELHISVVYIGDKKDLDPKLKSLLKKAIEVNAKIYTPFKVSISGLGIFNNKGDDGTYPLYASVDAFELIDCRQNTTNILEALGIDYAKEHGFTPHITLAYVKNVKIPDIKIPQIKATIKKITLAWAGEYFEVPFPFKIPKNKI